VMCRKYFTRGKWVWWNWRPNRPAQCNLWLLILSPPQSGCHQKPASPPPPWVGYLGEGSFVAFVFHQHLWRLRLWLSKMDNGNLVLTDKIQNTLQIWHSADIEDFHRYLDNT
jgi:hypothetical protein